MKLNCLPPPPPQKKGRGKYTILFRYITFRIILVYFMFLLWKLAWQGKIHYNSILKQCGLQYRWH